MSTVYRVKRFSWLGDLWDGAKNTVRYWWHTPGERDAIAHGKDPKKVKGFWANYKPRWNTLKESIMKKFVPFAYAVRANHLMKRHDAVKEFLAEQRRRGVEDEEEEREYSKPANQAQNAQAQQKAQQKQAEINIKNGRLQQMAQKIPLYQKDIIGKVQRANLNSIKFTSKMNTTNSNAAKARAFQGAQVVKAMEGQRRANLGAHYQAPKTESVPPKSVKK